MLAKPISQISVGEVLRALEGNLDAVTCPANEGEGGCEEADFCVTRFVWQKINDSITSTVDAIMLDQLVEEGRKIQKQGKRACEGSRD